MRGFANLGTACGTACETDRESGSTDVMNTARSLTAQTRTIHVLAYLGSGSCGGQTTS